MWVSKRRFIELRNIEWRANQVVLLHESIEFPLPSKTITLCKHCTKYYGIAVYYPCETVKTLKGIK